MAVGETLKLHIMYREFKTGRWMIAGQTYGRDNSALPEVETLVERFTDRTLEDFPALTSRRSSIVQRVVEALEMDANRTRLYNVTGRLEVPPLLDLEPELEPVHLELKRVPS